MCLQVFEITLSDFLMMFFHRSGFESVPPGKEWRQRQNENRRGIERQRETGHGMALSR